jgi:hypothetical protein
MLFQVNNTLKNNYYYTYKNHKTIVKISTKSSNVLVHCAVLINCTFMAKTLESNYSIFIWECRDYFLKYFLFENILK